MRIQDILMERASPVLYHYTGPVAAASILNSEQFHLSNVAGNKSEEELAPAGYSYFLSLARTKMGEYSKSAGPGSVMFVLNGNWFSHNYVVKPIDYWSGFTNTGRHREAEDRVFAKKNTMPFTAIEEVHVYLKQFDDRMSPWVREILILAKQKGKRAYLYTDASAFRLLDKRRVVPISDASDILKGSKPIYTRSKDDMLKYQEYYKSQREKEGRKGLKQFYKRDTTIVAIVELIQKDNEAHLSARAKKELHNLLYYAARSIEWGQEKEAIISLSADLFNDKKPDNRNYESGVFITNFMRKNKLDLLGLVKFLINKWNLIKDKSTQAQ